MIITQNFRKEQKIVPQRRGEEKYKEPTTQKGTLQLSQYQGV